MLLYIKYFPIVFCSLYIYYQIISNKYSAKESYLLITLNALFSIIISSFFASPFIRILLTFLFTYIITLVTTELPALKTLSAIVISYGFSFGIYIISLSLLSILYTPLSYPNHLPVSFQYVIFLFIIGFVQCILIPYLFKIKQFKKGIQALTNNKSVNLGIITSLSIILFIAYASSTVNNSLTIQIQTSIICILLAFLIPFWWRHRIRKTYIDNLRNLETLTYENTIADKDKQIKELEDNNAYLAQIIHKYRKVIPAMELSVLELLQNNANLDADALQSNAKTLQAQLEELRTERDNLLDNYQKDMVVTPQSGLHTVDAMIALMEKQAKEQWIRYKTQIAPSIKELALASVKEADLLHLLGDLIENALHAVNKSEHKEILIHFGKLNNCLLLEVSDSGIAFDIQTYQHFGNEPFTAHQEDGGSGTGLMDIWKLKKKYKISLYIYEYETASNVYTKKISFLFDRKNHFLLKTYREQEIKDVLIRGDLHVFPYKSK